MTIGVAVTAMFLTSCGSGDNTSESSSNKKMVIKPKSTSIKGELGNYFEVVDKDYNFTGKDNKLMVEVVRKKGEFEFSTDKLAECRGDYGEWEGEEAAVGIGFEIFDESGPVFTQSANRFAYFGPNGSGEVIALIGLKEGETSYITIYSKAFSDEVELNNVTSFQLTSAYETTIHGKPEGATSSHGNSSSSSFEDSDDWDSVLDDYDILVTSYIKLFKKAQEGDMSALAEYPSILEKSQTLSEKLESAKGDMTAKQVGRMAKIQTKMLQAATGN